jgi:putative flippase GtrA
MSRQFGFFLVTGGIAALVNFGSRILFGHWMSYSASIVLAYLCGMVTAFLLARAFVFTDSRQSTAQSVLWFAAVNLFAVLQTWAISVILARYLLPSAGVTSHAETLAHAVGIMVPVVSSYFGHKHFTFRS